MGRKPVRFKIMKWAGQSRACTRFKKNFETSGLAHVQARMRPQPHQRRPGWEKTDGDDAHVRVGMASPQSAPKLEVP